MTKAKLASMSCYDRTLVSNALLDSFALHSAYSEPPDLVRQQLGDSTETADPQTDLSRQTFTDERLPTVRNESPRCEYRKPRKELNVPRSNGQREICSLGTRHLQVLGGSAIAKWSRYSTLVKLYLAVEMILFRVLSALDAFSLLRNCSPLHDEAQ